MTAAPSVSSHDDAALARVEAALKALGWDPASSALTSTHDGLYEAYLLMMVVEAARRGGYTATLAYDSPAVTGAPTELRVRRGPGYLSTVHDSTKQPYSHPVLTKGGSSFGVYIGVRTKGLSRLLNEADILVLQESVAQGHVAAGRHPTARDLLIHVEAKHYLTGPVALGAGRSFVGMASDFHRARASTPNVGQASLLAAPLVGGSAKKFVDRTLLPTKAVTDVFPTGEGEEGFVQEIWRLLGGGGPHVHPGAFCALVGDKGISSTGKQMVCGKARDNRHRWKGR